MSGSSKQGSLPMGPERPVVNFKVAGSKGSSGYMDLPARSYLVNAVCHFRFGFLIRFHGNSTLQQQRYSEPATRRMD